MNRLIKSGLICFVLLAVNGCDRATSPFEGKWLVISAKTGNPMPYILIGHRGEGEYWDGFSSVRLHWTVEGDVLHVVGNSKGEMEDLSLRRDAAGSTLEDLSGRPVVIGGELVQKLASIAGDWEGADGNSLHIRENGFAVWKLNGFGKSELGIVWAGEAFGVSMRIFDRQLQSSLRADQSKNLLVWSSTDGKALSLKRVRN